MALSATLAIAGLGVAWIVTNPFDPVPDKNACSGPATAKAGLEQTPKSGAVSIPLEAWAAFRMDGDAIRVVSGSLFSRFRLAGTFRVIQPGDQAIPKAVLCDLVRSNQSIIVSPGDSLGEGIFVRGIFDNRVELVQRDVTCTLTLQFQGTNQSSPQAGSGSNGFENATQGYEILSRGQFGVQIQADRWLIERRKVLDYYNSVLEDADRLVALFDSLKPLYDESRKINGYILIPEGEKEFFKEVGLQEGDVIRKVNSVPMQNRRVAEGFIRDFGNNQLNVAVLELERAGQPVKVVYELR